MTEIKSTLEGSNYIINQLVAMALSLILGTAFATTLCSTTSLNAVSFHITEAVDSPGALPTFAVGPGLNDLSIKDDYASYQWILCNDGQVRGTERKLDIKTMDPTINTDESGVDSISLPPLGPSNFKALTIGAIKGTGIDTQPARELYDQLEAKRSVVAAIIDTGIDTTHPDLKDSMRANEDEIPGDDIDNDGSDCTDDVNGWDFLDDTSQFYVGKENSHGTHTTGTIATSRGNGGITGTSDGQYVKIMSLKALGGESGKGNPESVIAATCYAEVDGAQIYNLSSGSENYTEGFMAVIQNSKVFLVVAAGDEDENEKGYNVGQYPVYPASLPLNSVTTVTNLMFDGRLDRSSNYGPMNVDLAVPGCFILSTVPDRSYTFTIGISMAAPTVTGAAAMVYSTRLDLDPIGVKSVLLALARKLDTLNGRVFNGGMLDVYSTLQWGRPQ